MNTARLPRVDEGFALSIDSRLLAFTLGISLATGSILGLFPALQGSQADLNSVLRTVAEDRVPVSDVHSMSDAVSFSIASQRFNMLLMGSFGVVSMLLAVMGIQGLMAYSVKQRTHDVGIRL
ncbi:MAG: hypothetical protein WAN65_22575, partial [Candidatus Sulfotelmatobacter sp.]